ncbi:MAG: hypothetical protein R6U50_13010 [Desulfobacterales bacterium]
MQQRFCSCGHMIWVEYLFPNNNPKVVFRSTDQTHSDMLRVCPLCRKPLAIDELA